MKDMKYDFEKLDIIEKSRVYAYNFGNPMMIAEYINRKESELGGNGRVTYVDVMEMINRMSEEDRQVMEQALMIRYDYIAKRNLGQGNMMYDLKLLEKLHPEYRKKEVGVKIDTLNITLEHIKEAESKLIEIKKIEGKDAEEKEG